MFVLVGIVSMLLAQGALASPVDLMAKNTATGKEVSSAEPFSTCPRVITPLFIKLTAKNLGSKSDTYAFKLVSAPTGWRVPTPNDLTLGSSEELEAHPFLIEMGDPFQVKAGLYEIVIEARSKSSTDRDEVTIPIDVLACYGVTVTPIVKSQSLCQETGGSKKYSLTIKNSGKFSDTFKLTSSKSWAVFDQESVTVPSDGSKTVVVTLTPPKTLSGSQDVQVTAKSISTLASSKATLTLDIQDCYDYNAKLLPTQGEVCLGETSEFTLEIDNQGKEDTFTLDAPGQVKFSSTQVTVPEGQKKTFKFTVSPGEQGVLTFDITLTSKKDSQKRKVSGVLNAKECRGIAVILAPPEKTVCSGDNIKYTVTMKNTGTLKETFTLETSKGTLETKTITLGADETKSTTLSVDTDEVLKEDIIKVTASATGLSDSANTILTTENCFDVRLEIAPLGVDVCPCSLTDYTVTLTNTGKKQDTYTFAYANVSKKVTLNPGQKEEATFTVNVACEQKGIYNIKASATSDKIKISKSSTMDVKPVNTCFGMEISNGKEAKVDVSRGLAIPVTIKNVGEGSQQFTLSLKAENWMFLSHDKITVPAKQSTEVFVYASPPIGTKAGRYTAVITSSSRFLKKEYTIELDVGEDGAAGLVDTGKKEEPKEEPKEQPKEEPKETNKSLTIPSGGLTLNVSFEGNATPSTGEVTKKPVEIDSIKTIAIGIITVLIIAILVIRFAILVRK